MSVEYWNKEKHEWLPSAFTIEEGLWMNAVVKWEMYREAA